jgi:hypothetical protein
VLFQQKHAHDANHGQQAAAGSQLTFIMTSYPAEDGFQYSMELFVGEPMCYMEQWQASSAPWKGAAETSPLQTQYIAKAWKRWNIPIP